MKSINLRVFVSSWLNLDSRFHGNDKKVSLCLRAFVVKSGFLFPLFTRTSFTRMLIDADGDADADSTP